MKLQIKGGPDGIRTSDPTIDQPARQLSRHTLYHCGNLNDKSFILHFATRQQIHDKYHCIIIVLWFIIGFRYVNALFIPRFRPTCRMLCGSF